MFTSQFVLNTIYLYTYLYIYYICVCVCVHRYVRMCNAQGVCLLLIYLIFFARFDSDHLLNDYDHDSTMLSSIDGSPIEEVYKNLYYIICNKSGK